MLFRSALLKEERAIVSDIEGTTRDWIESWVSFDGIPARLFDTAGLRITDDVIEQRGVEMTKDLTQDADIILYLVDSTKDEEQEDIDFINSFKNRIPVIKVLNKIDVLQDSSLLDENSVKISAKTGLGISDLVKEVKNTLVKSTKSERTQAGLGSERQKQAIDEALDSVNHALEVSCADFTMDAVVQDLEDALSFLAEITGETTPDDILGNIFANFCVGK